MEDIKSPDYEDQEDSQLQDLGLGPKFIPKNLTQAQTVSNDATEKEGHSDRGYHSDRKKDDDEWCSGWQRVGLICGDPTA